MARRTGSSNFFRRLAVFFSEIDVPLFAAVAAISILGVVNLWGIVGPESSFFQKQAIFVALGLGLMLLFSLFNYRYLKNSSFFVLGVYLSAVGLLLLTLFTDTIRGTQSWLSFAGFNFEPVELAKLILIILLAKYFSQKHVHINEFRHIVAAGIYFAVPFLIVFLHPDLGSSVILFAIWLGVLMAAGMNARHLFLIVACCTLAGFAGWLFVLEPYQRDRLAAFVDPYHDPTGIGYNIIQSQVAIGSGHWLGNGFGKGTQSTMGFLPEPHNDFAFASLTEQFGFAGAAAVMALSLFIISRILQIGERTSSNFGKLFSIGLAIFIGSHILIAACVNVGLLPVTGLPFAFLSYGGSNIIVLMMGLGILQSIKRYG